MKNKKEETFEKASLRLRLSQSDAHYAQNLVSGARLLECFGDVATELLIRHDGDEGLFRAYEDVEFLYPVYAGDYLEVRGEITQVGNTSRSMVFEAHKVIEADPGGGSSTALLLKTPILVAKARGTCVVPLEKQKKGK